MFEGTGVSVEDAVRVLVPGLCFLEELSVCGALQVDDEDGSLTTAVVAAATASISDVITTTTSTEMTATAPKASATPPTPISTTARPQTRRTTPSPTPTIATTPTTPYLHSVSFSSSFGVTPLLLRRLSHLSCRKCVKSIL